LLAATKLNNPVVEINLTKKLLLSPNSTVHFIWDLFIMMCALYNGITLPIQITFNPDWTNTPFSDGLNSAIDVCFLVDIIIVFRTTITGDDGEEVHNPKTIAKEYLTGNFLIDLLSTIPFDTLLGPFVSGNISSQLALFGILKLIRVTRITRIIRDMRVNRQIKGYFKLFKLMFLLCLYLHCIGCGWYYFCLFNRNWVPP
jgi:hypothetical protein